MDGLPCKCCINATAILGQGAAVLHARNTHGYGMMERDLVKISERTGSTCPERALITRFGSPAVWGMARSRIEFLERARKGDEAMLEAAVINGCMAARTGRHRAITVPSAVAACHKCKLLI